LTRARVLIVDDESDFRATVAEYLNADGFEVVEAEDGVEALEQAKRTTPTAIVLDVMMPRLGGLQTLVALRQVIPDLMVVLVTGVLDPELLRRATAAGAYAVLLKPVALAAISAILRDAFPAAPAPPSTPA